MSFESLSSGGAGNAGSKPLRVRLLVGPMPMPCRSRFSGALAPGVATGAPPPDVDPSRFNFAPATPWGAALPVRPPLCAGVMPAEREASAGTVDAGGDVGDVDG